MPENKNDKLNKKANAAYDSNGVAREPHFLKESNNYQI